MNSILNAKLCVKDGAYLSFYSVYKNEEAIKKYREKTISTSEQFYSFSSPDLNNKFFSNTCTEASGYTLSMIDRVSSVYSTLNKEYNIAQCRNLSRAESHDFQSKKEIALDYLAFLDEYLQGRFDEEEPKVLYDTAATNAQMVFCAIADPERIEYQFDNVTYYKLKHILGLNERLYLLHLMLNRNLISLADRDIDDLLKLFTFEKENSITFMDVSDMIKSGLLSDSYEAIIKRAETGQSILKRAR